MSDVYDCSQGDIRADGIRAAVGAASAGRLVVFPTDTAYGIGTDAFSATGVAGLLAAKGSSPQTAVGVLIGSWATVEGLVTYLSSAARQLIEAFWPGGLSLVLPKSASLPTPPGDHDTIMVRMPLHPVALEVLSQVGPMAVSLAAKSRTTPVELAAVRADFGSAVSAYLDAGPLSGDSASTIVDLTGETPRLLRAGAIREEEVLDVLGGDLLTS